MSSGREGFTERDFRVNIFVSRRPSFKQRQENHYVDETTPSGPTRVENLIQNFRDTELTCSPKQHNRHAY